VKLSEIPKAGTKFKFRPLQMIKNIIFIYYNQNAEQIYNTLILNADDDLSKKM